MARLVNGCVIEPQADLQKANLRGADLRGADLRGADLRGADLSGAYLIGTDLNRAYLNGADLSGADLRGADLRGTDLRGTDLSWANLCTTKFDGAVITYLNHAVRVKFEILSREKGGMMARVTKGEYFKTLQDDLVELHVKVHELVGELEGEESFPEHPYTGMDQMRLKAIIDRVAKAETELEAARKLANQLRGSTPDKKGRS